MLTSLLGTSKQLVTALEKVDWLGPDLALTLLALVILFILEQHLVGRRLRVAFWWTRLSPKLPSMGPGDSQLVASRVVMEKVTTHTDIATLALFIVTSMTNA
jgi:protein transport protein SEC20